MKISVGSFLVPNHFLAFNGLGRNNLKKKKLAKEKEYYGTQEEERLNKNLKVWC